MANLDSNTWYLVLNGGSSALQSGFPNPPPFGSTFLSPPNSTQNAELWQIIHPADDSTFYVLRSRDNGSGSFMTVTVNSTCTVNGCNSIPRMAPTVDDSARWSFSPWNDGTFFMYNKANGSSWHVDVQDNGSWLWMNSNDSIAQIGQHWSFSSIAPINDTTYSTVALSGIITSSVAATTSMTTTTTQSTATPSMIASPSPTLSSLIPTSSTSLVLTTISSTPSSAPSTSNSGLSTGASAAIGGSIGGAALLIIAIGIFVLMRRRRKRNTPGESHGPSHDYYAPPAYEKQPLSSPAEHPVSELPAGYQPPELAAGQVDLLR